MHSNLSDEELMLAYANGDYEAFDALYQRHAKKIFGFLKNKLSNKDEAEEVLQDTFLRLHRFREKFNSTLPFLPWLFTICRNAMIDRLRLKSKVDRELSEVDPPLGVAEENALAAIGDQDTAFSINEYGASLSAKELQVLSLRYGDDFSFNKIAQELGMQSASVRKISQRALEKLRKLWN